MRKTRKGKPTRKGRPVPPNVLGIVTDDRDRIVGVNVNGHDIHNVHDLSFKASADGWDMYEVTLTFTANGIAMFEPDEEGS